MAGGVSALVGVAVGVVGVAAGSSGLRFKVKVPELVGVTVAAGVAAAGVAGAAAGSSGLRFNVKVPELVGVAVAAGEAAAGVAGATGSAGLRFNVKVLRGFSSLLMVLLAPKSARFSQNGCCMRSSVAEIA